MNANVELVYFSGCPNVDGARGNLADALRELGRDAVWQGTTPTRPTASAGSPRPRS